MNLDWNKQKFIEHSEEESYPPHYLKCEKDIEGTWVTTGWAPHVAAAKQHAMAIGGVVRASDASGNVLVQVISVDNEIKLCETNDTEQKQSIVE